MFTKTSALALLAATAAAVPAAIDTRRGYNLWVIDPFTTTCTDGTCRYGLSVSGDGDDMIPPFIADRCGGSMDRPKYRKCGALGTFVGGGKVVTQAFDTEDGKNTTVSIRFSFENGDGKVTYEGNATFPHANGGKPVPIVPFKVADE